MIPVVELAEQAARLDVARVVVEQDYALGWLAWAIAREPSLAAAVAFKGGTALKKVFFGDYRFSEDLDFGMRRAALKPKALRPAITRMLLPLEGACGIRFRLSTFEPTRDDYGAEVYRVLLDYGWAGITAPRPRAKLDLHYRGGVVEQPVLRPILHAYSDAPDLAGVEMPTCTLEEIVAEKLVALVLQSQIGTPRPRDYYDVDRILRSLSGQLDGPRLRAVLGRKLVHPRRVAFEGIASVFPKKHLERSRAIWDAQVRVVARDAEPFDVVIERLRRALPRWLE